MFLMVMRHGDHVTVLDVSFEKNVADVKRLLDNGASIDYLDHHKTGELITHDKLLVDIDLSADTCTSLIVDKRLNGKYRAWAVTAAFGDNLSEVAMALGKQSGFTDDELKSLKQLGILLNYNGYGASVDDLFFHPAELFPKLQAYDSPLDFIQHESETFLTLDDGYKQDMARAKQAPLIHETSGTAIIELPNEAWARRVSGVYGNELVNQYPNRAHAILTKKENKHYLVSVRAPLNQKYGADELVGQFPTGGGRKAAAGINSLPSEQLAIFIESFQKQFS